MKPKLYCFIYYTNKKEWYVTEVVYHPLTMHPGHLDYDHLYNMETKKHVKAYYYKSFSEYLKAEYKKLKWIGALK